MKNKIVAMLVAVCIMFLLVACDSKEEYTVLEIGGYDYVSEANHKEEFRVKLNEEIEGSLAKEKTIEYSGIEYDVNYEYTRTNYLYNSDMECYAERDGLNYTRFGVNKTTGKIDMYGWLDISYLETPGLIEKSRDECLSIAKDQLASLIEDPEQYELEVEALREIPEYDALYVFEFVRKINGVKTADSIRIDVTIYGILAYYRTDCFGVMRGAKLPDQEQMTAIQADIDKKLDAIYEPIKDDYSVTFELDDMVFERLADGRYALEYYYEAELISLKDENPIPRRETTRLIVILENN